MFNIENFQVRKNVKKTRNEQGVLLENNSDAKGFVVFPKPIYIKKKSCKISNEVEILEGEGLQFKVLNRKFRVVQNVEANTTCYFEDINKLIFVGITVLPHTKVLIKDFKIDFEFDKDKELEKHFQGKILLLCPGYPSNDNKYRCAFIHTRMQAYQKLGLEVDLALVNENFITKSTISYFENVKVVSTGYNDIRKVLQNRTYEKILIHFFDEKYAQVLDASNVINTDIFLFSHGSDTLYRSWDRLNAKYFENETKIPSKVKNTFNQKDQLIKRYNEKENVKFIFVSNWAKDLSEKLIGIKYKNALVIPCNVDTDIFKYEEKDPSLRKKICIIRKYDNLSTYSIDISVKIVLALSTKEYFKDLEFSFYGDGDYHDELLKPLVGFDNVHIYKKFLTHEEIKKVHDENGINLIPTRFDTQGVSACEAAMSGQVVITSYGVGTEEYINPEIGTYCHTENIDEYVSLIEKIYYNEDLFLELSKKMHDSVAKTCSYEKTIGKDLELIKKSHQKEETSYPQPDNQPLLTIAIPSYNVGKFLEASVHSLIDHKYASKLEILIINDGSKDNTLEIGKKLEELTKTKEGSIVKIIDKPNGGHGSTINKGIELARGKYFRLMDGDDYFIQEDFLKFLEILEKEDSDIILTNYVADYAKDATKVPVHNYSFMTPGVPYKLDLMKGEGYSFTKWGPLLSTSTYKTSILKKADFKIDEHCFYVDMEYNFIGYLHSDTVVYYPLDIYNYYLERNGQSVSAESYRRNFKQHEKVTMRLIKEYEHLGEDVSCNKKDYLMERIIIPLVEAQYYILTQNLKSGKEFREFDKKLKKYPEIYNNEIISRIAIRIYRRTNGYLLKPINGFIGFKNSILYRLARKGNKDEE